MTEGRTDQSDATYNQSRTSKDIGCTDKDIKNQTTRDTSLDQPLKNHASTCQDNHQCRPEKQAGLVKIQATDGTGALFQDDGGLALRTGNP